MTIGVVCSGGGSAVIAAHGFTRLQGEDLHVVTDRPCGIESWCRHNSVRHDRIEAVGKEEFSERAAAAFEKSGVGFVMLYFDRLVGAALYERWHCINFHPSLLPAYSGFRAIDRAVGDRVRFLGHTCHLVDATPDAGPIIAQSSYPLASTDHSLPRALDISFVQKLALTLLAVSNASLLEKSCQSQEAWANVRSHGPVSFVNPNALAAQARSIVIAAAVARGMNIEI